MSTFRSRVPCETPECDSTTGFGGLSSGILSNTTSHCSPVEHSEENNDSDPLFDPSLNKSLESIGLRPNEKGPDSTFNANIIPAAIPPPPPAYNFSENNVQNYYGAAPRIPPPHESALRKLQPIRDLPVTILGTKSLTQLSLRLDPEVVPTQNWRMMAEYMNFNNWEIRHFAEQPLKTKAVIDAWSAGFDGSHTVGDLLDIIHHDMERLDVITDIPDLLLRDAERHSKSLRRIASGGVVGSESSQAPLSHSSSASSFGYPSYAPNFAGICPEGEMPTMKADLLQESYEEKPGVGNMCSPVQVDVVTPSIPFKKYDAFILCNYQDKEFVIKQFLPKVEDDAGLNLCFAERDIPPGNLKFPEQMDYMFSRSQKLVVILSDEFFKSREHEWQSNLAISRDPASRQQRIIPVKYKRITVPNIFDHLGCCDLTRTMKEEWFWNKIIKGIKM